MGLDDKVALGRVLVSLYKGVVYRDKDEAHWTQLLARRNEVATHFSALGLTVGVDEAEGYAYLKTEDNDDESEIPRLVPRRPLTYMVSLLLALLRKRMLEADKGDDGQKLIVNREQLVEMVTVFLPVGTNEARITDQIGTAISKVEELGFLRRLPGDREVWEVRRVLKAFITAQWLADFETRIEDYRTARTPRSSE